jgi:hypothetical protein
MALVLEQGRHPDQGPDAIQAFATPFLYLTGHVLCAWLMGRSALKAQMALHDTPPDSAFYRMKLSSADFALRHWLPLGRAQLAVIEAGVSTLGELDSEAL